MKKSRFIVTIGALGLAFTLGGTSTSKAVSFYDTIGTKYEGAVERLAELKVVSGTSANVFSPEKKVTRAEFAKMLVEACLKKTEQRALEFDDTNSQKFKDLDSKEWYYKYVTIAINNELMSGYEDGTFKPNKEVTYSEIAKMVTRALGHKYLNENDPAGWDVQYIDKAWQENLFDHVDFKSPHDSAIRGDVANIIWNMLTSHEWEMIYRNDTSGFSYVDSNHTLAASKIIDHVVLVDAKIQGYSEIDGDIWVQINGSLYRMFDQKAKVYFSTIGGTSDVLLKRVEYPGKIVRLEVVGISTDIGAQLYSGTFKELTSDKFKMINKSKLSAEADYAFLYHYENDPEMDRTIQINLSNTYLVDKFSVKDKKPEGLIEDKDADKSHSSVPNEFVDDDIAYRYSSKKNVFDRTIEVNDGELLIEYSSAVLFKNNVRVEWSSVKKGDILVEITPHKYYFIQTGDSQDVKLTGYSTEKNNYYIETSKGRLDTYATTLYENYLTNDFKKFNSMKKADLDRIVGKNIRITQDISDRVVKIALLEDEVTMQDLHIAFYVSFHPQDNKTGLLKVIQDGKQRSLYTSTDNIKADAGNLFKYEYEKDSDRYIKSISIVSGSTKLTDKLKIDSISLLDLQSKLKYFEDDEIVITKVTNHYKFAKYKYVDSATVEKITIDDVNDLTTKDTKCFALVDAEGVMKQAYIVDNKEQSDTYYGLITQIAKRSADKKYHAKIMSIGASKDKDLIISNVQFDCEEGDFIVYTQENDTNIMIGEYFSPKNLGYYQDLVVKSANIEKKKEVSYNLNNGGIIDLDTWTIEASDRKYKLNNYEVFILNVSLDKQGTWKIDKINRMTKEKPDFKAGDRIAMNEIEGTAIVYRGYTE